VPDGLMAIRSNDDLIRYTKYSKDFHSKEKTERHAEKEETQEGGANIMLSLLPTP